MLNWLSEPILDRIDARMDTTRRIAITGGVPESHDGYPELQIYLVDWVGGGLEIMMALESSLLAA